MGTENNTAQSRLTENTDLRRSAGQAVLPEAFRRVSVPKMAANLRPGSPFPPPPPFMPQGACAELGGLGWVGSGRFTGGGGHSPSCLGARAEAAWGPRRAKPNLSSKLHKDNLTDFTHRVAAQHRNPGTPNEFTG